MKAGYVKRGFAVAILLVCVVALPGQAGALLPTITVSNATATEGGAGAEFTVTLSEPAVGALELNWSASPTTDVSPSSGTATVPDGQSQTTFTVNAIDDALDEENENFTVTVSHAEGSAPGQGTVVDNDLPPSVQIGDVTVVEGNAGTVSANFNVQLSGQSAKPITVRFATGDGTATAPADFAPPTNQSIEIAPLTSSGTISVAVKGDAAVEGNEHFFVNLTSADNATLGSKTQGRGDITDDDVPPSASINDVAVTEGNVGTVNATFTVTLSSPAPGPVQIRYSTLNGSAIAPSDYVGVSNALLSIATGQSSGQFSITVNGDTLPEGTGDPPSEEFFVDLISATGATISGDSRGIGKIIDEPDVIPPPTVSPASLPEGNNSTRNLVFNVTVPARGANVTFNWSTVEGSATASGSAPDYSAASGVGSRTYSPSPTPTNDTIVVAVLGDTLDETDETFTLRLSRDGAVVATAVGTITNDDNNTEIQIADASADEPSTGTSTLKFAVSLSVASGRPVSVGWQTANGTAAAGADYNAASGTVNFAPGETTKAIEVTVIGDTVNEPNETVLVNFAGSGANLIDAQAQGTIIDKNAPPSLSISDALAREGGGASFIVELAGTTLQTVTVGFSTGDLSAREPGDYTARRGTLTFAPGEKSKTLVVSVVDDTLAETVETFSVTIGDVVNGAITKSRGVATIEASDQVATSGNGLRPTTPPASPTILPKMVLAPRTVNVTRTGFARLFLTCTKLSPIACRGSITLQTTGKPAVKLGSKTFVVAKGKKKTLGVKLSPRARKLLAKRPTLRARVVVLVKTGKKSLRVVPGVITLKAAPKSAKPKSAKKSTAPKDTPPKVTVRP